MTWVECFGQNVHLLLNMYRRNQVLFLLILHLPRVYPMIDIMYLQDDLLKFVNELVMSKC